MKKLSKAQIKALATTEAASEYRATQDKWLHATCMIEDAIELDDYSKLNQDAMDWAVEILEDALEAAYGAQESIINSYYTILLGETVECVISIDGMEMPQRKLNTVFSREKIERIATAHAGDQTVRVELWNAPQRLKAFIEQPLPADITPDTVAAYYQSL